MLTHTGKKCLHCEICGFNVSTIQIWDNMERKVSTWFNFFQNADLKWHLLNSHWRDLWIQLFPTSPSLKKCMLIHTGEKNFLLWNLWIYFFPPFISQNMLAHTEKESFHCQMLGVSCSQYENFKWHMITHPSKWPSLVSVWVRFLLLSHLKWHMLTLIELKMGQHYFPDILN